MITPGGFSRPTIEEIREQVKTAFRTHFTQIINGITYAPSLEPESFLGILAEILAEIKDDLYQDAEDSYYSNFLATAEGVQLDRLALPTIRKNAIKARGTVKFIGDPTTVIPADTIIETEDKRQYKTLAAATIPASGDVTVAVEAVIAGLAGNAPENALTFLPVPISGIDSVTNETPIIDGADIESDAEFRRRAIDDRTSGLTSSLTAIVNRVKSIAGVLSVSGTENLTLDFVDGIPPGAFEIVVRGGDDNDIARTIFDARPAGIASHGAISVTVYDSENIPHIEKFSRVTDVEIWVNVQLTCDDRYSTILHNDVVKRQILKYIGGVSPDSITYSGLRIGEDVFAWRAKAMLFDINNPELIPGLIDATIKVAKVPSPITADTVVISSREEAFTQFANIAITVTYV